MGERALAAVARASDGRQPVALDCYRSQWAGSDERAGAVLAVDGGSVEPLLECRWNHAGLWRPCELLRTLDYLSVEILYLVSADGVDAFVPVWLGIPAGNAGRTPSTRGAIVPVASLAELRALRAWIRGLKELFGLAVDDGYLSVAEARACLLTVLRGRAATEPPATCTLTTHQLP